MLIVCATMCYVEFLGFQFCGGFNVLLIVNIGFAPSIIGFNFGSEISFWPESSNGIKCQGSQVYLLG